MITAQEVNVNILDYDPYNSNVRDEDIEFIMYGNVQLFVGTSTDTRTICRTMLNSIEAAKQLHICSNLPDTDMPNEPKYLKIEFHFTKITTTIYSLLDENFENVLLADETIGYKTKSRITPVFMKSLLHDIHSSVLCKDRLENKHSYKLADCDKPTSVHFCNQPTEIWVPFIHTSDWHAPEYIIPQLTKQKTSKKLISQLCHLKDVCVKNKNDFEFIMSVIDMLVGIYFLIPLRKE